jgi:hypothetical protein
MSEFVTVTAKKPLDVRNFKFDPTKPPSKTNPVSVPVKPGETFELPAEHVADNVMCGNIEPVEATPAAE